LEPTIISKKHNTKDNKITKLQSIIGLTQSC
jgi:hypothetical protein